MISISSGPSPCITITTSPRGPSDVPNVAARAETTLKRLLSAIAFALEGDLRDYQPDAEILTCDVNVAPAAWLASRLRCSFQPPRLDSRYMTNAPASG